MNINISAKLLENIVGKVDKFGLARILKTGQTLNGKVIDVKGNSLIIDFGKGPVLAKTKVKLQRGDIIRAIIKEVQKDTLILKLIEKKESNPLNQPNQSIKTENKEKHIPGSLQSQAIIMDKKNIEELRYIINKEETLKNLLKKDVETEDKALQKALKIEIKKILQELSRGFLIERKDIYELIFVFPYINEDKELLFQKIIAKFNKKRKKEENKDKKSITFSLNMSKIGPIKIDMDFINKNIYGKIYTRDEEINEYINKHINILEKKLKNINFTLKKMDLGILDKSEILREFNNAYKKILMGIDIKI